MNESVENRTQNMGLTFLVGLVAGVLCFVLAELSIRGSPANPGDHDLLLANRLGFIYTITVGLWLAWLQRSWQRGAIAVAIGVGIGLVYMWLCASRNFLAIMVGFPCLLGGVLAAAAGSNRSHWLGDLGWRIGKGLLAGVVLGFVYMFVLNMGMASGLLMSAADYKNFKDPTDFYVAMMWRDGPLALGISSALFFVLIRWAVGLTRAKIVFEEQ